MELQAAAVLVAVVAVAMTSVSGASGEDPNQRENRDSVIVCSFFPLADDDPVTPPPICAFLSRRIIVALCV